MKKSVIILFLISCSSSTTNNIKSTPEPETEQNIVESVCLDSAGEILACVSNEDCCPGFSCGFDPEKSRVQRYCNFSGH